MSAELREKLSKIFEHGIEGDNIARIEALIESERQAAAAVRTEAMLEAVRRHIDQWQQMRNRERVYREGIEAFKEYVLWAGDLHQENCPKDDTCNCALKPVNDRVKKALAEVAKIGG